LPKLRLAVRAFTVAFGCLGVAWGVATFSGFWRDSRLEPVATRIIKGESFRPEALLAFEPNIAQVESESPCRPAALRNAAIVQLRIAEDALDTADARHIDQFLAALQSATRTALECSPTDAFLWFVLFWVDVTRNGFHTQDVALLRMSYLQGPNEGWVMERRNRFAIAMYGYLPADLNERALNEFAKLLQPQFVVGAVNIFVGPGWPIHDLLLERIKDRPESERRLFAQILKERGYDVTVPGIAHPDHPAP
jgi:hypothetical protein